MFVAANPEKGKTTEEKEELSRKYKVGDEVLVKIDENEKSLRERRVEDADRRLVDSVRDLSMRDNLEGGEERRRRRRDDRLQSSRNTSSREHSGDNRGNDEERRRRREMEAERRRVRDDPALRPAGEGSGESRRRRSNDDRRPRVDSASITRRVEHQSSLRSLISSSDIDSREMEEEILRQIRDEGLLDGIDLENIDVNQEDQISERIAEAFRRRQHEISRTGEGRTASSGQQRRPRSLAPDSRNASGDESGRSRRRGHSRSQSNVIPQDASRPPQAPSANQATHLEAQPTGERRRRRTSSTGRSATTPIPTAVSGSRSAARSQTDLSDRPRSAYVQRPAVSASGRSTTDPSSRTAELGGSESAASELQASPRSSPNVRPSAEVPELPPRELPANNSVTSSPRIGSTSRSEESSHGSNLTERRPRAVAPAQIIVSSASNPPAPLDPHLVPAPLTPHSPSSPRNTSPGSTLSDRANAISSGTRPTSSPSVGAKHRPQLYPEPSLTCSKCAKPHIEYELHYNCYKCRSGNWNICLSCYRSGAGCMHWFGFGYSAWNKYEYLKSQNRLTNPETPHMLTANRYLPPKRTAGGADGRKTLTTDDPHNRLQSGAFCASCLAWANECYWRCDVCNEGDWGFCNICVNQGRSCTHDLLPLRYKPNDSYVPPPASDRTQQTPPSASILTGPGVIDVGPFKPLTFSTTCDICHYPIQPSNTRYHCLSCVSKVPNTLPGDYDICTTCYPKLVSSRRISVENGDKGWRRCLQGHRMIIVGFEDKRGGQRRIVVSDLVGGLSLIEEVAPPPDSENYFLWSWGSDPSSANSKLVTKDVMKSSNTDGGAHVFPPNGGQGMNAHAMWSWYPAEGVQDELMFPRGAEVRECRNVNGDWWAGVYMGKKGVFPAPYVQRVGDGGRG